MSVASPDPSQNARPRARRVWARVLLTLWIPGVTLVIASWMVGHWAALPAPTENDTRTTEALVELRDAQGLAGWTRVHVLFSDCGCSKRVFDALVDQPLASDATDVALLVGDAEAQASRAAEVGLTHVRLTTEDLEQQYGIVSAPLLLILAPDGSLAYAGGHTDRKRGFAIQSDALLERLRAGEEVEPLPVFGCGVSRDLQRQLDPLGLKY